MYPILHKRPLNASVTLMEVEAPYIARKARAGQFIILRVNETGERIPLTIADHDADKGSITIMYQKVGKTTLLLDTLQVGGRHPRRRWAAAGRRPTGRLPESGRHRRRRRLRHCVTRSQGGS